MNRPVAVDPLGPSTYAPGQLSLFPQAGGPAKKTSDTPEESRRELRLEAAPRQARLPVADDIKGEERAIATALKLYLPPGKGLELRLTNNHYSMISVRRKPDGYRLRLHRMFAGANPRTVRALARYVVHNDRRASRFLGEFIERNQHVIKLQPRPPRRIVIRTSGKHHDLRAIFDRLNAERFGGNLEARITWGTASSVRARRSIKMGSFAVEDRVIRIHPILDQPDVPEFFVAWIVFHEMLHGKHDIIRKGDRRVFHSQAFIDEEKTYPDFDRSTDWERANLDRLLGG